MLCSIRALHSSPHAGESGDSPHSHLTHHRYCNSWPIKSLVFSHKFLGKICPAQPICIYLGITALECYRLLFPNLRKHSSKSLSQPTIPEEGPEHEEGVGASSQPAQPSFTSKILAAVSGKTATATDRSQAVKTPPTGTKVRVDMTITEFSEFSLSHSNFWELTL